MGYRFSRGGIEFFGDSPEMFAGVVRAKPGLSGDGQRIVNLLNDLLRASVLLRDEERRETRHLARSPDRVLLPDKLTLDGRRACTLRARVNDRYTLIVVAPSAMHHDAESLVKWAADKLAVHLPRRSGDEDEPAAPSGGDGGSGGGAEIGIPIWWARKARN